MLEFRLKVPVLNLEVGFISIERLAAIAAKSLPKPNLLDHSPRLDLCCRRSSLHGVEHGSGARKLVNVDIDVCES